MAKVTLKVPEIKFRREKIEVPVTRVEAVKAALRAQQERVNQRLTRRNDEIAKQLDKAMQTQQKSGRGKKVLLLGVGAVIGGAAGVLAAPTTGKTVRSKVAQQGGKLFQTASKQTVKQAKSIGSQASGKASAAKARFSSSSDDEVVDLETITARVQTNLGEDPKLRDLPRINVNTEPGNVVRLHGVAPSEKLRERVEKVVRKTKGVSEVVNEITVTSDPSASSMSSSDAVQ